MIEKSPRSGRVAAIAAITVGVTVAITLNPDDKSYQMIENPSILRRYGYQRGKKKKRFL
jgi:hypothetical protein